MNKRALVACEESQVICIELRRLGWEAYSCDIQECSGGHPEWHIMQDVIPLINGFCTFRTMDGTEHVIDSRWDLLIAHPPCTFLTVTGNRWFNIERYGEKAIQRFQDREAAIAFFMAFANADCKYKMIENPIGVMSTVYRTPDQIVQPYFFGEAIRKSTCLWLFNLPHLTPTKVVEPDIYYYTAANGRIKSDSRQRSMCNKQERSKHRSKTPIGLGKAIAEQFTAFIEKEALHEITV